MAKKKLLHLIGWISLIIVTTANINAVANNDVGGYIDGNVGDNIGSDYIPTIGCRYLIQNNFFEIVNCISKYIIFLWKKQNIRNGTRSKNK